MLESFDQLRGLYCLVLPAVAVFALFIGGTASAQTTYGLIRGSITDLTGAALPGAVVTVAQPKIGLIRTSAANEQGLYSVFNLSPAEYDVAVRLSGFADVKSSKVKLDAGLRESRPSRRFRRHPASGFEREQPWKRSCHTVAALSNEPSSDAMPRAGQPDRHANRKSGQNQQTAPQAQ